MPAKRLRCEAEVSFGYDPTGENAEICGAAAVECADCGGPAGCLDHACFCLTCGKPVCDYCEDEHACPGRQKPSTGVKSNHEPKRQIA
jgi:hypothetical protein